MMSSARSPALAAGAELVLLGIGRRIHDDTDASALAPEAE
jgi:hypothetical protein